MQTGFSFANFMIKKEVKDKLYLLGLIDEEINRISELPVYRMGDDGEEIKAAIDEEARRFYFLDKNQEPTGEVLDLGEQQFEEVMVRLRKYEEDYAKYCQHQEQNGKQPKKKDSSQKKSNKEFHLPSFFKKKGSDVGATSASEVAITPKILVVCCVVFLVIGISFSLLFTLVFGGNNLKDGMLGEDQKFPAIQVTHDIIPGEMITEDMLAKLVVNGNTYNQSALNGAALYTWDDVPYLIGMYATEYIPSGKCLTHNSVQGILDKPQNPFLTLKDGYSYLDIPVNLSYEYIDSVVLGRYMDITLNVETLSNRTERVDTEEVPGLDHSSSVTTQTVVDTYKLPDVVILDMIAADGTSLFETLNAYNAIPDGELQAYITRYVNDLISNNPNAAIDSLLNHFNVATIRIQLPTEQVKAIGKLDAENTTAKIHSITDSYLCESEAQRSYLTEARFTIKTLATVFSSVF